jgi:putative membrane protein
MKKFVSWLIVNAAAVGIATWLFKGIALTGHHSTGDKVVTLLVVGLIFGLVTAIVRPVVTLFALPAVILSLGLMLIVINALMLLLTSKIAGSLGVPFHVHGFWTAVGGAVVISIASMIVEGLLPDRK